MVCVSTGRFEVQLYQLTDLTSRANIEAFPRGVRLWEHEPSRACGWLLERHP